MSAPTVEQATGMRNGIVAQCEREGLKESAALYARLDPRDPGDARIIQSTYARMAREATGRES